jgi:glycolate oxidase FAD binding subunit
MSTDFKINGIAPREVLAPTTREEVAQTILHARDEGWGLVAFGGGTRIETGSPPARLDFVLSTQRLGRVVDYQPDDMTVTVEPGLTLGALEKLLAARGQFLPLDPPLPERATVGGTVAAAVSGPWRAGYGTPRDWLIGCRVVGADGKEVRGGGQVVKNVAGYDLPKLYTGSYGTLGVLTELTFKVMPKPPHAGYCRVELSHADDVESFLAAAMGSDLQPASVELFFGAGSSAGGWSLFIEMRHVREAVEWQLDLLRTLATSCRGEARELTPAEGEQLGALLRDLPAQHPLVARIGTVSGKVAAVADRLAALCRQRERPPAVWAHAATGQVFVAGDESEELGFAEAVRGVATDVGADCVFERLPAALIGRVDPWGDPGPGFRVMQGIKRILDPTGIFSPGRFAGRL